MSGIKGGTLGILLFIFGMLLTIYGWFWVGNISDLMPIGLLKGIFWGGMVTTWVLAFIVNPYVYISGGNAHLVNIIKGIITFFFGTFVSVVSYWIVPQVIEVGEEIFSTTVDLSGIAWLMLIIAWILLMIVIPAYFLTKDITLEGIKGGVNE